MTFSTDGDGALVQGLVVGDAAQVTYATSSSGPVALGVTVTGSPASPVPTGDGSTNSATPAGS
jgi:hypothetical protein